MPGGAEGQEAGNNKKTRRFEKHEERTCELVDFAGSDGCEISTSSAEAALPARHDDIVLVIYALVDLRSFVTNAWCLASLSLASRIDTNQIRPGTFIVKTFSLSFSLDVHSVIMCNSFTYAILREKEMEIEIEQER